MASLKPKLFCGVAFRTKGRLALQARRRWEQLAVGRSRRMQFTPQYLSNDCSEVTSRATPPHRQNQPDAALHFQTVSPKRETIRIGALTVKRRLNY